MSGVGEGVLGGNFPLSEFSRRRLDHDTVDVFKLGKRFVTLLLHGMTV